MNFDQDKFKATKYTVVLKHLPTNKDDVNALNEDVKRLNVTVTPKYHLWYNHVIEYGDTFIKNDLVITFVFENYNDAVTFDDRWSIYE
jgi:hypothetical protein